MHKLKKDQVDYSHGHRDSHCGRVFKDDHGYCRYFIEAQSASGEVGACEKVEGSINPVYWCKFFSGAQG